METLSVSSFSEHVYVVYYLMCIQTSGDNGLVYVAMLIIIISIPVFC